MFSTSAYSRFDVITSFLPQGRRTPTLVVTPPTARRRPMSPLAIQTPPSMKPLPHRPQSPNTIRVIPGKQAFVPGNATAPLSPLVTNGGAAVNQAAMPRVGVLMGVLLGSEFVSS